MRFPRFSSPRRPLHRITVACLLAALPLAAHATGAEQDPPDPSTPLTESPRPASPPLEGMVAVRDSETGELRAPTADELAALAALTDNEALRRDDEGLEQVVLPDGTVMVDLRGRFQSMSIAVIGDDGVLRQTCTTDAVEATRLLAGHAAASDGHDHPVPAEQEVRDDR